MVEGINCISMEAGHRCMRPAGLNRAAGERQPYIQPQEVSRRGHEAWQKAAGGVPGVFCDGRRHRKQLALLKRSADEALQ